MPDIDKELLGWCEDRLYAIGENSWSRPYTALELSQFILAATRRRRDRQTIWRFLMSAWSGFDLIPHDEYTKLLARLRKRWSADYMQDDDRRLYGSLPDRITVYRGQDASHVVGLSWSLSPDVARRFARGHRAMFNENPIVLRETVEKLNVAFVCTGRNEDEAVIFHPEYLHDVTVIGTQIDLATIA